MDDGHYVLSFRFSVPKLFTSNIKRDFNIISLL